MTEALPANTESSSPERPSDGIAGDGAGGYDVTMIFLKLPRGLKDTMCRSFGSMLTKRWQ